MRMIVVVTAMALSLGFASCGSPAPSGRPGVATKTKTADKTPDTPVATDAPAGSEEDAEDAVRAAVALMRSEKVTSYRAETWLPRRLIVVTEGAMVGDDGWESTTRFDDPKTAPGWDSTMRARSTSGSVWMQTDWSDARAGCWLTLKKGEVPLGIQAMRPDEPAYVSVLGSLRANRFANDSRDALFGDIDLGAALSLMTSQLLQRIDTTSADLRAERVPLQMGYDGRRISGLAINGIDLLDVLEHAGATVGADAEAVLKDTSFIVNYPKVKRVADVSPPPADLQFFAGTPGCH